MKIFNNKNQSLIHLQIITSKRISKMMKILKKKLKKLQINKMKKIYKNYKNKIYKTYINNNNSRKIVNIKYQ